jgi:hypothetical protein
LQACRSRSRGTRLRFRTGWRSTALRFKCFGIQSVGCLVSTCALDSVLGLAEFAGRSTHREVCATIDLTTTITFVKLTLPIYGLSCATAYATIGGTREVSRRLARLNLRVTNPIPSPLARRPQGLGITLHVGRKSHYLYRTPVMVFRRTRFWAHLPLTPFHIWGITPRETLITGRTRRVPTSSKGAKTISWTCSCLFGPLRGQQCRVPRVAALKAGPAKPKPACAGLPADRRFPLVWA